MTRVLGTSRRGWEETIQGMVHLAFMLIDGSSHLPTLPRSQDKPPVRKHPNAESTPQEQAVNLGAHLLAEAFKVPSF
jgi:hypothetical protein